MAGVINGRTSIAGNVQGCWTRGLSAYDLAVQRGFRGTVDEFLESLKAIPLVVERTEELEDGIKLVLTDENGEHEYVLRNGLDITVTDTEKVEGGIVINFSDGSSITIGDGAQGPAGIDGREIVLQVLEDILYWNYDQNDEPKQLVDFGTMITEEVDKIYAEHPPVMVVDQLPSIENAVPGVTYRVPDDD